MEKRTIKQELEKYLSSPYNQDIYFDVPSLFDVNDDARLSYMKILFNVIDTFSYDEWLPEDKLYKSKEILSEPVNTLLKMCNSSKHNECRDVLEDFLLHIKKHGKAISERVFKENSLALFINNSLDKITLDELQNLQQEKILPDRISLDLGKTLNVFADIRGFGKEEPAVGMEDLTSMKKVLAAVEFGVIKHIENTYKTNKSQTYKLVSAITGVSPDLIKRYVNGYITGKNYPHAKNNNNPASIENKEWLNDLISKIK